MFTRTERRTRMVPHTKFGKTSLIPEDYDVDIPIPPRDWDRLVLNGVWGITGIVIIASVTWSTSSIGDLLAGTVQSAIAYGAASVFDAGSSPWPSNGSPATTRTKPASHEQPATSPWASP